MLQVDTFQLLLGNVLHVFLFFAARHGHHRHNRILTPMFPTQEPLRVESKVLTNVFICKKLCFWAKLYSTRAKGETSTVCTRMQKHGQDYFLRMIPIVAIFCLSGILPGASRNATIIC